MDLYRINREVNRIVNLIRKGYNRKIILDEIKEIYFDRNKLFEIAKSRIRAREKFGDLADKLFFDEEGLRYATSPDIATYRADRLKECKTIADVSCGVAIQAIYFSYICDKIICVEKDRNRAKMAELNFASMGRDNIEVILGDSLNDNVFMKINADCIFSDPARKPEETIRKLETLEPSPIEIYSKYKIKTNNIAVEVPPRIERNRIRIDGELEYTSMNFRLNRVALYTGDLAIYDISAVTLPSKERITNYDESLDLVRNHRTKGYIYEVDPTIIQAGLLNNLAGKVGFDGFLIQRSKRRTLLSSSSLYKSAFLRAYAINGTSPFNIYSMRELLRELGAEKVTLRFAIDASEYWSFRRKLEHDLSGDKHIYLFRIGDKAVMAEPVSIQK